MAEGSEFESRERDCSLLHEVQTGPTQWILGAPSLEVKRPKLEANHSPTSSAGDKNVGAIKSVQRAGWLDIDSHEVMTQDRAQ
jgi:hypothetical protein